MVVLLQYLITKSSGTPKYARAGPVWRQNELTGSPTTDTTTLNQPHTNRRTHSHTHPRIHRQTHQPINPPTMYYIQQFSSTGSSRCTASHALVHRYSSSASISILKLLSAIPGSERSVPGRALHAPRLPSRSSAPVLSSGSPRAAVWGGRDATLIPLEAE